MSIPRGFEPTGITWKTRSGRTVHWVKERGFSDEDAPSTWACDGCGNSGSPRGGSPVLQERMRELRAEGRRHAGTCSASNSTN